MTSAAWLLALAITAGVPAEVLPPSRSEAPRQKAIDAPIEHLVGDETQRAPAAASAHPRPATPSLPGATALPRDPATRRFSDGPPENSLEVVAAIAKGGTFQQRLLDASERFLGTRYLADPLGEGPGAHDADPRLRFDAVDCMTYVETVLALALPGAPDSLEARLSSIRYLGSPVFENRHHFFNAQWARAGVQKGMLRDITRRLGGPETARHLKRVTSRDWARRRLSRKIDLPEARAPIGTTTIDYLPIDRVLAHAERLPPGTIFTVVREDRPDAPFMVTHLGFIARRGKAVVARHAGRNLYGQVIDEDLAHFVGRLSRYRKWRVLGMQFFEPRDPAGDAPLQTRPQAQAETAP